MFNFRHINRTATRHNWQDIYRIARKHGERGEIRDESVIGERAYIEAGMAELTIDGRIGVVESGMDCDCVRYCHGRTYENLRAIGFQHLRDGIYEWADGPCHVSLCRPDELPESYSRDLALEAFEDGHPHVVYDSHEPDWDRGVSNRDFGPDGML